MFCPKCGKAEQQENSYCRQCGEFLPDLSRKNKFVFGGHTPEEQIKTNLFLNLLSAVVSLVLAILLYWTFVGRPNTPPIVYLVAAFLVAMMTWQLSTFLVGLQLRKNFRKRRESGDVAPENQPSKIDDAKTKELLPEADFENAVPPGITENTTRHLKTEKR